MKRIAIIGAMPEEIEPIVSRIENIKETIYGNNKYYEGTYQGKELVVAYSKIGKVFSTLTATILIEKFKCDTLLFSGVAGAISKELKIGDIFIADKLCQHDIDITPFGHPHGFIPESKLYISTDIRLKEIAKDILNSRGKKVVEGIIATGDQFIANNDKKQWIKDTFNADVVEMEGASVAIVCEALNIPFFILRTISDTADMNADFNFEKFMIKSAQTSADFILRMVEEV